MGLRIITPPTVTPLSVAGLDLLKQQLQEAADVNDQDALIEAMTAAAWQLAERHTWRQFLTAGYRYTLRDFTAQHVRNSRRCRILIPRPPLIEISEVRYIDANGDEQTLDEADYVVLTDDDIGAIIPAPDLNWPDVTRGPNAVTIEFTCGYGTTAADMPPVLMHAIRLQLGAWWLNRESVSEKPQHELPAATTALLESIEVRDDRLLVI